MTRRTTMTGSISATDVRAVRPQRGRVVHLWAPGYRRNEASDEYALCAAGIYANGGPSHLGEPLEDRLTPLPDAVRWSTFEPSTADPRPIWSWCRNCLGHLVVLRGMERDVLTGGAA